MGEVNKDVFVGFAPGWPRFVVYVSRSVAGR